MQDEQGAAVRIQVPTRSLVRRGEATLVTGECMCVLRIVYSCRCVQLSAVSQLVSARRQLCDVQCECPVARRSVQAWSRWVWVLLLPLTLARGVDWQDFPMYKCKKARGFRDVWGGAGHVALVCCILLLV